MYLFLAVIILRTAGAIRGWWIRGGRDGRGRMFGNGIGFVWKFFGVEEQGEGAVELAVDAGGVTVEEAEGARVIG